MNYEELINRLIATREDHEKRQLANENSIRPAFHSFIQSVFALDKKHQGYKLTIEEKESTAEGRRIFYDATVQKNGFRLGVIENKDASDDLEKELASKTASHYDLTNAIFENGYEIWLIREGQVIDKVVYFASGNPTNKKYYASTVDLVAFSKLIKAFLTHTSEQELFYKATLTKFEQLVPYWASEVKTRINAQLATNSTFKEKFDSYYEELKVAISEDLSLDDVKEVLTQHILTIDLFEEIVKRSAFRRTNPIAKIMDHLMDALDPVLADKISQEVRASYRPLNRAIDDLGDEMHYKVDVLKSFYQHFYHSYNTDDKDKLGIVYTPTEIINFMVHTSNLLLREFFGKRIFDKGVNILDPCTGTGSFIVMIMQYICKNGGKANLPHKFAEELLATELSILAYYVAVIHIELAYEELMGEFAFFKNITYADTLANQFTAQSNTEQHDRQRTLFDDNTKQVKLQNDKTIQLIIGNPPYRANQKHGNENKKNNVYRYVDSCVKATYVKHNKGGKKLKVYDMYTRFVRWASDRIKVSDKDGEGMVSFITNRSYLDAVGFNGFRANVMQEFSHVYVLDLGGDMRKGDKSGNVFGIKTGVAIAFFIKTKKKPGSQGIYYCNPFGESDTGLSKLEWLANRWDDDILDCEAIKWHRIVPNEKNYWLEQSDLFTGLVALGDDQHKNSGEAESLFYLYSLGVATNRDAWMYDINEKSLARKVNFFVDVYHRFIKNLDVNQAKNKEDLKRNFPSSIKANRKLLNNIARGDKATDLSFEERRIVPTLYRPFTKRYYYYQAILSEEVYQMPKIFPIGKQGENLMICVLAPTQRVEFCALISNTLIDLNFFRDPSQCFPLYRYTQDSEKVSNINPTYKAQFETAGSLTDEEMFAYIYAMLHHRLYRSTYAIDLKQNLPSVPVSPAVKEYVHFGQELMQLHLNYETASPYPCQRVDMTVDKPVAKLKSDSASGTIIIDSQTTLKDIPSEAWAYKLGNKSAIDWVLEGYSEKKNVYTNLKNGAIADPTSTLYTEYGYQLYNFAEHKEELIDLVSRVITVSLRTEELIKGISALPLAPPK